MAQGPKGLSLSASLRPPSCPLEPEGREGSLQQRKVSHCVLVAGEDSLPVDVLADH